MATENYGREDWQHCYEFNMLDGRIRALQDFILDIIESKQKTDTSRLDEAGGL